MKAVMKKVIGFVGILFLFTAAVVVEAIGFEAVIGGWIHSPGGT